MTVTSIPDPSTKLYYNANGGTYYHIDPNCSAVNPKYLPMASFLYGELDSAPYSSLQPCLKCAARPRSRSRRWRRQPRRQSRRKRMPRR